MTGSKEGAIKWHHNSTKISCMKNPFSRSENNSRYEKMISLYQNAILGFIILMTYDFYDKMNSTNTINHLENL